MSLSALSSVVVSQFYGTQFLGECHSIHPFMYHSSRIHLWYRCVLVVLLLGLYSPARAQVTVRNILVRILDARTKEPLPQAVAHLGKQTYQANTSGEIRLSLSPKETDGLHVHVLGYHEGFVSLETLRRSEGSPTEGSYTLYMTSEERVLTGVTVQGTRRVVSANAVVSRLSSQQIERSLGRNLASLLTEISGVTSLQTGTTTAKPVIHGMYGNRVLIMNNGVRQSGQQWGEDHAPEVDVEGNNHIQVIKGAEAVRYGAEAMAGAIVMEQAGLPYGEESLHGAVGAAYATNGHRGSTSLRLEGATLSDRSLAYRVQGSYTNAGDRSSAKYRLMNTGVREFNTSLALGWKHGEWSVEGLFSRYENKTGLLPSGHLRSREGMAELLRRGMPDIFRPFSRSISNPYHHVVHYLGKVKGSWENDHLGRFTLQASLQRDNRDEYAIRRNAAYANVPTLSLSLSSSQLDASWRKHYHRWDSEAGVHGEYVDNYSNSGTGFTPPIPNYTQSTWGGYALQRYADDHFGAELGVRLDGQQMSVAGYDVAGQYFSGDHSFLNLTYSLGGHLHLGQGWKVTSNFGLAWRSPHVQELYSLGSQHGSAIFVYGDRTLRSERGYKWVSSLVHHSERWDLTLDGYLHWIKGYIYDEPSQEYAETLAGQYPVFRYKQSDAFFRGVDLDARYFFIPSLLYARVQGSMIWANEMKTGRYYPYIPALRVSEELGLRRALGSSYTGEFSLSHRFVDRQRRFDPATDLTQSPPAYHLFGLEARVTKQMKERQSLSLSLSVDNLLDTEYKEYTNRARYYSHDVGRDVRLALHWHF